jgi:hypothetical protein
MPGVAKLFIIVAHAFVGWELCFATIGVGMVVTTVPTMLLVHAVAAPVFFAVVAWVYFTRFAYTTPLRTALAFTGFVVVMDFVVVALVILHSFEMFTSPLGTWIPFVLIFASTWLTGLVRTRQSPDAVQQ